MIVGIGTDIIEIYRIKKACEKSCFLNKVFTKKELLKFKENINSLSGNFSAKEAVSKALGCGFKNISPKDIEILRDKNGKPYVTLYNKAFEYANMLSISNIHISISHNKKNAIAYVILETSISI